MSATLLAILGFATIVGIIVVLLKNWTGPMIAFIAVPCITAVILILTGTASLADIGAFVKKGVQSVHGTAVLFIFSVTFFGIMSDVGMFDVIINALVKRVGNNVVGVAVMTCIIAMIGHLDGGGASTFLITIPAMYPIYKRLRMRPTTLMLICVTAMGVMNLLPWGGPTMRTASILKIDSNDLWKQIIPMQFVGIVIALFTAVFWGFVEKKRGAGEGSTLPWDVEDEEEEETVVQKNDLARPKLFWFNVALTLAVILGLVFLPLQSYHTFMIGCVIALLVNYPGTKMQKKIIKLHCDSALMMATTILSAGVFLGILEGTVKGDGVLSKSIMTHMANLVVAGIPQSMGHFLPLIIGVLSVPLALFFSTDSYFYGLLPVLIPIGQAFGVAPIHIGIAMVVCRNCATFISPCVPATFLGTGLAHIDIKGHIKNSFLWVWGVSLVCLISGIILGIVRF
ncbi:MAG: citrate:proton symporter [Treponema sp.]|nr:citrate:proton symporter [Treponema sp.]